MNVRLPEGKSRLMVVEGKEDQEFFIQLATYMNVIDNWPLHIEQLEGKGNFGEFLRALKRHPRFSRLTALGIVRDADFNTDALQSIQDAIRNSNKRNDVKLDVPERVIVPTTGSPSISVIIMPSDDREGMLEDLIMDVFAKDPVKRCVDIYIDCLKEDFILSQERLPKARLRTFITGKNVGPDGEGSNPDRLFLSDVFHMSWWRDEFWNNPTFDAAKAFLTKLLAD